jgi:hypothetical protein
MKLIKHLTFGALAVLVATLLYQTSITRADAHGQKGDRDHRDAKVTLTKWITGDPNLPGLLQTLEGVVGGDIGNGTFAGEVLKETIVGDLDEVVAFYHFNGSKHSFSAIIHLKFDLVSLQGVVIGVVTDGWLKGHALEGRMTAIDSFQGHSPAFPATFEIKGD